MIIGLFAEAAEGVTPTPSFLEDLLNSGAMKFMLEGGIFMWPILLCAIMAAAVISERWRSLKMLATDNEGLKRRVVELLQADKGEEALETCIKEPGPVSAVLAAGLKQYVLLRRLDADPATTKAEVDKAMEDYGVHIVAALERHLPILATVASVAPMIGFLGTVQGMVISFKDIVVGVDQGKNIVKEAAAGINIALLTTVFGLMVAIPAFTAYNYFTSVINRYVLEVEETASELLEAVTLQKAIQSASDHGAIMVKEQKTGAL
jgi:biopolymer transport protein ExbB